MGWVVERVALKEIRRRKTEPNYGFVEHGIAGGSAYKVEGKGGAGYFIVADENSLVPGFVVEVTLPEFAIQDDYEELADEMSRHSLGVLWFDSSDRDAGDLAWRLGVVMRSGPPLFRFDGLKQDLAVPGVEISNADESDKDEAVKLLTSAPPEHGGQTREAAIANVEGKCVVLLRKAKDIIGAAVVCPVPGPYLALNSVVMQTYSDLPTEAHQRAHRNLELFFMNAVALEARKKHRHVVYSMARQTPEGYLEAIKLNMTLVKQSFLANLRVRVDSFGVAEPI